jgi:hypothetical protein
MMKFRLSKRAGRSVAELRADSGTIRYELDMLILAAQQNGLADARGDVAGKNMAVESFAAHCRALILFLFGHVEGLEAAGQKPEKFNGVRDSDIFAWDYYPGWQYDCPEPSDELYHAKKRADKHVMHITTDRRGVNQTGTGVESVWQLHATVNELAGAFALFLSKAPALNFDPEELRAMKERLALWLAGTTPPTAPVIAKSGPLDDPAAELRASAWTAAPVTVSLFYPFGRSEPPGI